MTALVLALAVQLQIPAPTGYVNDFAGVIDAASRRTMTALIDEVHQKSRGEMVVVTLRDLEGRASIEVARDIIRQWRVGARGDAGDRARNAGVVVLLKPGQRPGDGQADLAIGTGTGAEGFITDARAGRIRDAIGQTAVETGSYAAGLVTGVRQLAAAYAAEFSFELTGGVAAPPVRRAPRRGRRGGLGAWILLAFIFFILFGASRRRRGGGLLPWLLLGSLFSGRRYYGGWGGGWGAGGFAGGGFGGFGGGGFGGFGGGGGAMGGGASGRF